MTMSDTLGGYFDKVNPRNVTIPVFLEPDLEWELLKCQKLVKI